MLESLQMVQRRFRPIYNCMVSRILLHFDDSKQFRHAACEHSIKNKLSFSSTFCLSSKIITFFLKCEESDVFSHFYSLEKIHEVKAALFIFWECLTIFSTRIFSIPE